MSEPYPWLTDEQLEEIVLSMAEEEDGMIVTDLAAYEARERTEYDGWCDLRDRQGEAA